MDLPTPMAMTDSGVTEAPEPWLWYQRRVSGQRETPSVSVDLLQCTAEPLPASSLIHQGTKN